MEPLPEELVEETWQEFAGLSPGQANKIANIVAKTQPNLMSFVLEFTEDLDQEVKDLAIYMFFVVHGMFENGYGKEVKKVSSREVIECYERNEKLLESLEGAHEKFYDRIAEVEMSSQPYIFKYVVETLFEAPEDEDPVFLSEDDVGFLFLLLKTVIDLLNKKTDA